MKIVAIHEATLPIGSAMRNASIAFDQMTASALVIRTDQSIGGEALVGLAFDSIGRYGKGGLLRERFIPRLLAAPPEALRDDQGLIDPARCVAVLMRGMSNDIYFQIGLVTLIGLAAKNAILIVEFAAQKQAEGMSALDAAVEAARLRFRPIVMTSLAFVLGVVPLVFATGAGAAARRSMGTGVFGGMLAATFIATLFIPLFFVLLSRAKKRP